MGIFALTGLALVLFFTAAVLFGNFHGHACGGAALQYVQALAKALEVYDFSLSEEAERIEQSGVIRKGHKVLVGCSGFLLCCHILVNVGDRVTGALDIGGGKGDAIGVGGEYAFGVHGEVAHKACFLYFLEGSIAHALVYHGADHFPMGHFLCSYRRHANVPFCLFCVQASENRPFYGQNNIYALRSSYRGHTAVQEAFANHFYVFANLGNMFFRQPGG